MTQQEIAMRCGKVQSTIANKMRLPAPPEVLAAVRTGETAKDMPGRCSIKTRRGGLLQRGQDPRVGSDMEAMCSLAAG